MPTWQIVLICVVGAVILSMIAAKIIGKSLKNKKNPNFRPVLNKKEKLISLISVGLGIAMIVGGILLPKPAGEGAVEGEEDLNISTEGDDPEKEGNVTTEGDVWVGGTVEVVEVG